MPERASDNGPLPTAPPSAVVVRPFPAPIPTMSLVEYLRALHELAAMFAFLRQVRRELARVVAVSLSRVDAGADPEPDLVRTVKIMGRLPGNPVRHVHIPLVVGPLMHMAVASGDPTAVQNVIAHDPGLAWRPWLGACADTFAFTLFLVPPAPGASGDEDGRAWELSPGSERAFREASRVLHARGRRGLATEMSQDVARARSARDAVRRVQH